MVQYTSKWLENWCCLSCFVDNLGILTYKQIFSYKMHFDAFIIFVHINNADILLNIWDYTNGTSE